MARQELEATQEELAKERAERQATDEKLAKERAERQATDDEIRKLRDEVKRLTMQSGPSTHPPSTNRLRR